MSDTKKWWLISNENVESIRKALEDAGPEDALHDLESGLNTTECIPDDWKEHPAIKVEQTIDQWVHTYGYYVAKSHRYDGAWLIGGLLDVDVSDVWGDPCEKEVFKKRLTEKYNSLKQKETNLKVGSTED